MKQFFEDIKAEMKKVDWPTRQKVSRLTSVVLLVVVVITTYIFVADVILGSALVK